MTSAIDAYAVWLADYFLLATVMLGGALAASVVVKQPARKLAIAKSSLVGLVLLAMLCAVPGWSVVHLLAQRPVDEARADAAVAPTPVAESMDHRVPSTQYDQGIDHAPEASSVSAPRVVTADAREWPQVSWSQVFAVAHVGGAACVAVWLLAGSLAARRLRRTAQAAPADVAAVFAEIIAREDASGWRPELLVSEQVDVAVALGVWRPVVLLPSAWVRSHSLDELRTALAHEAAHIRNRDLHWLAASRALLVLLWAQPLYWLLRRRMRLDQEALADAAAAELTGRQRYAEQLVAWARELAGRPAPRVSTAVGLWEGPSQLRNRISLLLSDQINVLKGCSNVWRISTNTVAVFGALGLSLLTIAAPPNSAANADIETSVFQHSIQRLGVLPENIFDRRPVVLWKAQPEIIPDSSTPSLGELAVKDSVLYGSDSHRRLFALDCATGRRIWSFETVNWGRAQPPLLVDEVVYYACADGVVALNQYTGELLWKHDIPFGGAEECSPVVIDDRLFVTGYDGSMRALDTATGDLIWERELLSDAPEVSRGEKGEDARFQEIKARPRIPASDGKLIFQPIFDQMRVVAVDCVTSDIRWSFETDGWISGNPLVHDGRVYIGSQDRRFSCLDADTGEELWRFQTASRVEAGAALHGGRVYFGCCAGIVYCADAATGTEIWRFSLDRRNDRSFIYCSPLVSREGNLYIAGMEGQVYCLDAPSGKLRWKIRPSEESEIDSNLATDGERLFITTRPTNDGEGESAIFALGPPELASSEDAEQSQGAVEGPRADAIRLAQSFNRNSNQDRVQTEFDARLAQYSGRATRGTTDSNRPPALLSYGDGKPDGKKSYGGSGHLIRFELPEGVTKVRGVRIHGSRYGLPQAPQEDFEITFLSEDREEILHSEAAPYRLFQRGKERWVRVMFDKEVELPKKFWIALNFNAHQTKGVYVSYDTSTKGEHSRVGRAGDEEEPKETDFGGDWMVQVMLSRAEG